MTENSLKNTINSADFSGMTPDSLSGLIFGFEGIRNSITLLNGPTGCKFYHSITADNQSLRKDAMDPLNYPEEWFFGQGRVPCTYLDKRDYVYGSDDKIRDAVKYILERIDVGAFVIVNSPGAALIGDDLEKIVKTALSEAGRPDLPFITCQSPGYSEDVSTGYQEACEAVLKTFAGSGSGHADPGQTPHADPGNTALNTERDNAPTINILGLSIYHKYHAGDIKELTRLLALMGIRVNTALLCESTFKELASIGDADLNILIDPEYGKRSAEYLEREFGTPYVGLGKYPVGFSAAEQLVGMVFDGLKGAYPDLDPRPAYEDIEKARGTAYIHISRMSAITGLPKGVPFMVRGSQSFCAGYSEFLTGYLGMIDVSANHGTPADPDAPTNHDAPVNHNSPADPDIVLADGNTIAIMKSEGKRFTGIETALPSIGYIDVIEKTHLGPAGALFLVEQILNGLVY